MAIPVIMPKQGQSVESCILTKWYKKKGDKINIADLLFNYETDKASFDEEAKVSGTMLEVFFNEGDDVPVFTNVCVIGNPGENIDGFYPKKNILQNKDIKIESLQNKSINEQGNEDVLIQTNDNFLNQNEDNVIKISPRAKKSAEKIGIDLKKIRGSGPDGRIVEDDIILLKDSANIGTFSSKENIRGENIRGNGIGGRITIKDLENSSELLSDYEEVKLSNIRKIIAKGMHNSILNSAQLTLHSSFDAAKIIEFRKKAKLEFIEEFKNVSINDIILFVVSRTILKHASINAHFNNDTLLIFKNCHLGIAVDTERGLMVPTLFNANKKLLNEISKEAKELIENCKKGSVNPDILKGATFTITNLGTLGIEMFTPILNIPQTGILGVNTIIYKIKEINNEIKTYPSIGLSFTFDHRALDGATAAKFLQDLRIDLENFTDFIKSKE